MRFFFDENFPKAAAKLLTKHGHESVDIRGTDREGSGDTAIFEMAQEHEAALLTTDRDFFHTVPHLQETHHGVIVVALHQPNRKSILQLLEWFLEYFKDADIRNRVF